MVTFESAESFIKQLRNLHIKALPNSTVPQPLHEFAFCSLLLVRCSNKMMKCVAFLGLLTCLMACNAQLLSGDMGDSTSNQLETTRQLRNLLSGTTGSRAQMLGNAGSLGQWSSLLQGATNPMVSGRFQGMTGSTGQMENLWRMMAARRAMGTGRGFDRQNGLRNLMYYTLLSRGKAFYNQIPNGMIFETMSSLTKLASAERSSFL